MDALAAPLSHLAQPDRSAPHRREGPRGEGAWARALRWIADGHRLREMDERLLRDIGLSRADLAQGRPFRRRLPSA